MIIGLTGKKGCGKSTVGEYLAVNYGFEQGGFADILKEAAGALFHVHPDQVDQWKNERVEITVSGINVTPEHPDDVLRVLTWREMLQRFGTEMGRNVFGENFWVDQFWLDHDLKEKLVITDVRFNNEAESIKKRGGKIIQIHRSSCATEDSHASELGIDSDLIDASIHNESDFFTLHLTIDELLPNLVPFSERIQTASEYAKRNG